MTNTVQNTQLLIIGTCVLTDILKYSTDELYKRHIYEWPHLQFVPSEIDYKISALAVQPGPIAERLSNEMGKTIQNCLPGVRRQYNAIVKPLTLAGVEKIISNNNVIPIIDFHSEMFRTFDDGREYFGITPYFEKIAHAFPSWLVELIFKNQTSVNVMNPYDTGKRHELLVDVANSLDRSSRGRVIMLDNVFTTKVYDSVNDSTVELSSESLIQKTKIIMVDQDYSDQIVDLALYDRIYDTFYKRVRIWKKHWQIISPDRSKLMSDLHHYAGWHPCHLHKNCFDEIQPKLIAAIDNLLDQAIPLDNPYANVIAPHSPRIIY